MMTTTYTVWDSDTSKCIAQSIERDEFARLLIASGLGADTAASLIAQAGPPGSLALERYGFTVLVDYESVKVHHFVTSRDAYDASQTRDNISDGDILSVPSEHVIGVLLEAWPVAIILDPDSEIGCFHRLAGDVNVSDIDGKDYGDSFELAVSIASERSPCPNCGEASIGAGGNYNPLDRAVTIGHERNRPGNSIDSTTIHPGCPVCNTPGEQNVPT